MIGTTIKRKWLDGGDIAVEFRLYNTKPTIYAIVVRYDNGTNFVMHRVDFSTLAEAEDNMDKVVKEFKAMYPPDSFYPY